MSARFKLDYTPHPDSELLSSQLEDLIGPEWDERDLTADQREILCLAPSVSGMIVNQHDLIEDDWS